MEDVGRRTFRIESCLGRGGFGEVYKALMSSPGGLQSEVAVKVLRGDLDPAGQAVQRLRDEGRLLARLDHPTILRVHDLVLLDGRISLVTEFIDGQDLGELVHGTDSIPLRALLEVIGSVAGALHAAWSAPLGPDGHTLQIVHRDIKPSNIRISRHGQVKLLDFGIARTDTVDREARTQTNLMVGSPVYMAPERFTSNEMMPASDVFALGCALYEGMADGDRLLGELTLPMLSALALDETRYEMHVRPKLAPVRRRGPDDVVKLLVAMLAWDPAGRPGAVEVQHRCEELAEDAAGRSLARYCRERGWPKSSIEAGQLDGRVITEGTLVRSRVIAPVESSDAITERGVPSLPPQSRIVSQESLVAPRPPAPRRGLGMALAGGGAVAVAFLALLAVTATVAGLWASGMFQEDPVPVPVPEEIAVAPTVEPITDAALATPEPAAPTPDPPTPSTPDPVPVVAPPRPVVVVPAAVPSPTVAAAPAVAAGHVEVTGGIAVELRDGDKVVPVPGDVPAGSWEVFGRFNGRDMEHGGSVTVEAGSSVRLKCSASIMRCNPQVIVP